MFGKYTWCFNDKGVIFNKQTRDHACKDFSAADSLAFFTSEMHLIAENISAALNYSDYVSQENGKRYVFTKTFPEAIGFSYNANKPFTHCVLLQKTSTKETYWF